MKRSILKDIKSKQTGSISTLVLFTVLMFLIILMATYLGITTLQKAQLRSDSRIQEIYGQGVDDIDKIYDELTKYAKYDKPYIPKGFVHTEGTWNNGYTIKESSTGNEFVWVPCVLDQTKVKEGDTVVTFGKTLPTTEETTDTYYKYNQDNLTITGDESPTSDIRTSVGKYGGFYIAKYEAGIEGTEENYNSNTNTGRTVTDGSVKPLSQEGKGVWNAISREDAIRVAGNMVNTIDGVKSGLISGEAWDTTLQWMVNSSENSTNEPNIGYDIDSTGKGWYYVEEPFERHLTGYYEINNIYDMAGNIAEWTTENCLNDGNISVVYRSGYSYTGLNVPPAYRRNISDNAVVYCGFRVVLYK